MSVITLTRVFVGRGQPEGKGSAWLERHRVSLYVLLPVLALVAVAVTINFDGFPGRVNDDEGTYVAQAWSLLTHGELSHYTYWYDHPPFGWIQIAGYAWLTDGFHRAATAVTVGREFMVLMHLLSCGLIYALARRLHFGRLAGVAAILLFTFGPIALYYHRMVFLDNIAVMWTLAALVFAASPRRSLAAVLGSAMCFAGAVLTKETALVILPVVLWVMLQHQPKVSRGWSLGLFLPAFGGMALFYPLYAILKNELLEGPGHVSLVWAVKWQLFLREGTGSVFDTHSVSYATVHWWVETDPWLLIAGLAAGVGALFVRRLRPIGVALVIQAVMLTRSGYLPQAYVIMVLPFAALAIAGVGDVLFKARPFEPVKAWPNKFGAQLLHSLRWGVARTGLVTVLSVVGVFGLAASPAWADNYHNSATYNQSVYSAEATQWIEQDVPKDATVIVDDNVWADLTLDGYTRAVWLYKADLDPAIKRDLLPHGYRDVDYVVLLRLPPSILDTLPIVKEAINQSDEVRTFGGGNMQLVVWKVRK